MECCISHTENDDSSFHYSDQSSVYGNGGLHRLLTSAPEFCKCVTGYTHTHTHTPHTRTHTHARTPHTLAQTHAHTHTHTHTGKYYMYMYNDQETHSCSSCSSSTFPFSLVRSRGTCPLSLGKMAATSAPGRVRRCWTRLLKPCRAAKWINVSRGLQSTRMRGGRGGERGEGGKGREGKGREGRKGRRREVSGWE